MPIYAYRCASCGAEKDVLQKFSDAALTVCPVCATESFQRVLTAPAFQLKGSGWYVTDFRDGNKAKDKAKAASDAGESAAADRPPATTSDDVGAGKSGAEKSGDAGTAGSTSKGSEPSAASAGPATPSGTA